MGFTGEAAAEDLTRLRSGMSITGIVQVATRLGVADVEFTPVRRLLRGLASVGVFDEVQPDRYAHNEVSRLVRSDVEDSTERDFALLFAAAGPEFVGVTPTASSLCLIEARLPAT